MAAWREPLRALCLLVLALPFCTSKISQDYELAETGGQALRTSNGRHLLQTSNIVRSILLGDADGGLTLGSITVSDYSQVVDSTTKFRVADINSNTISAIAGNIAQTGCGVMQLTGTGSSATNYAAFLNLTRVQPPNEYQTRNTNARVSSNYSAYFVGGPLGVGQPAGLAMFPYPYSITPIVQNDDTITRSFNVSATFRPVGKACFSATFANDGQQASPVVSEAVGEDVFDRSTGGSVRSVLLANATCFSIKLEAKNAPTVDTLNATLYVNITAYAKLGVTGKVLNQSLASMQQSFTASNITSPYSGSRNDLDPSTIYAIETSGIGPTKNAVRVSVRVAMLTQKDANCGTQLMSDLSLARPPSRGK